MNKKNFAVTLCLILLINFILLSFYSNENSIEKSFYQIAKQNGFQDEQNELLKKIFNKIYVKGDKGDKGDMGLTGPVGATGAQGIQGVKGDQGAPGISPVLYCGSFYDTTSQLNSVVNTPMAMTLSQSTDGLNGVIADGISVIDLSKITISNTGIYNIQLSAQVTKTSSGTDPICIWLSKNGLNVDSTATQVAVGADTKKFVAAWNFVIDAVARDYFQLMWLSPDKTMEILYVEPQTINGNSIPTSPSLILTVT